MKRLFALCLLVTVGCSKSGTSDGEASAAQASAAPEVRAVPSASVAVKSQAPQTYSGKFSAVRRASATTKKQGAPSGWEKDDGKQFSGEAEVALTVSADGQVEGTLKGALGEQKLRGHLEGDELRAQLVPTGEDVKAIQNGSLSLKREGNGFKGSLVAATGDALVMRQADVAVTSSSQGS